MARQTRDAIQYSTMRSKVLLNKEWPVPTIPLLRGYPDTCLLSGELFRLDFMAELWALTC